MSPAARPAESPGGFAPRAPLWLAAVVAGSLLFALLLSAGGGLPGRAVAAPSTFSWSALGHRALAELLRASGLGVAARQSRDGRGLGPDRPLVLAEPDPARLGDGPAPALAGYPSSPSSPSSPSAPPAPPAPFDGAGRSDSLRELVQEAQARDASLVVVLPKWQGRPLPGHPGWVGPLALRPPGEAQRVLQALALAPWPDVAVVRRAHPACRDAERDTPVEVALAPAQLLVPGAGVPDGALEPIVRCGDGLLIARGSNAHHETVVIADPDLLNNQGLGRAGHAALIHDLLAHRLRARGVVFDETLHGFRRGPGLLDLALAPPLLPATLATLLLLALAVWSGAARFGKPLPAAAGAATGKEVLIANTADLLTAGGHAADSLARYYQMTLRAVAAASFLPPDLPEADLLVRLEELGAARGVGRRLAALARGVRDVRDERDLPAAAPAAARRAAAMARQLYLWRMEMTDGRRRHP